MATNISIIDSGGGGDYTTITAWEADTDLDLVAAGDIEIGRIAVGDTQTHSVNINIKGATTDASNYRQLDAEGAAWDPVTGTGSTIRDINGSVRFRVNTGPESHRRIIGLRFFRDTTTPTTAGNAIYLDGSGAGQQCIGCTFQRTTASSANLDPAGAVAWQGDNISTTTFIANCIAFGNGLNTGFNHGFVIAGLGHASNLVAYNFVDDGIQFGGGGRNLRNCIAIDNGNEDIDMGSGSLDFCMSSDATATGASSHTSETAADNFNDAASNDFTHVDESNAVDGAETQSDFSTDILGVSRPEGSAWDMGPYELFIPGPVCTDGVWSSVITFEACDDFRIEIDGLGATSPKISVTMDLEEL